MAVKFKDIRQKHQIQYVEIQKSELDPDKKRAATDRLVTSLVIEWDYTGEDGEILPIVPESIPELKLEDIDELSEQASRVLFPKVKKTSDSRSSSGSTPSKPKSQVKEKSLNGSTISSLAVGQG